MLLEENNIEVPSYWKYESIGKDDNTLAIE